MDGAKPITPTPYTELALRGTKPILAPPLYCGLGATFYRRIYWRSQVQLRVRQIARNVFSNWLGTAATMAVGFFLSPYIVHRLGNEAYGIWVLAMSSINYLSMLDLGMRSSVLRHVSKGHTVGDHDASSAAISGALWIRLQLSLLVLVLTLALTYLFPVLFKVPAHLGRDARIAVFIIGLNLTLGMTMTVFGGVVSGLNRYDLQTAVTLVQIVLRVSGVVFVLSHGHGIVAIAICEFVAAFVGNVLLVTFARRIYPQLRIVLRKPAREITRSLWSYSIYAFLTTVALQLLYQTDNLVVGSFVSVSAVTFYAIGNSLCRYSDQFISAMSMSFVPAASTYEAAGDTDRLQSLYLVGTRASMALSLPVLATLLVRGRTFIGLWMGPQYAHISGTVLIILGTALIFSQANTTAFAIAFGTEKHKIIAKWAIGEGITNLALSITLVHWFGLYGVAIGTLIPNLFTQLVLWPPYIGRLNGMTRWQVMFGVWGPMLLSVIPFALLSSLVNLHYPPHSIAMFLLQTLGLLPVFLLALTVVFREQVRTNVLPAARAFLVAKTNLFAQ